MKAQKISIHKANTQKLFYFVANAVVFREDGRCLILKRSQTDKVHPGKYCVLGGKLEWGDLDIEKPTRMNGEVFDFEDIVEKLLAREAKEEAGIEVKGELRYINSVGFIRPDGIPAVLVKYGAEYSKGEVRLEEGSFCDFAWVNKEEIKDYDCIEGIKDEVKKTIELFKTKVRP